MADSYRKQTLLERLTPPAPVPRPQIVIVVGWGHILLGLATGLCAFAVPLLDLDWFGGVPAMYLCYVVMAVVVVFGTWRQGMDLMALRSGGWFFVGRSGRGGPPGALLLAALIGLRRLGILVSLLIHQPSAWSSSSTLHEIGVVIFWAAAALLIGLWSDVVGRALNSQEVRQAFQAAEAIRQTAVPATFPPAPIEPQGPTALDERQ